MTSVPNWISQALIFRPDRYLGSSTATPIVEWRATKTQVIVRTAPTGPERRFYLDSLTEVGQPKNFREQRTRLVAPDDEVVAESHRQATVRKVSARVSSVIERQRMQDTVTDPEVLGRKLTAIRDAATEALAALAEVL